MKTFKFQRDWYGYSRGTDTVEIVANTLEEAEGKLGDVYFDFERNVVRDDTENEGWELTD